MVKTSGVARRLLEMLAGLAAFSLLTLSCGDPSNLAPDSQAPSKTTVTVTGTGTCTPLLCPESSQICPAGLHCFEGTCLNAECKPACQYATTGVVEILDAGGSSGDLD